MDLITPFKTSWKLKYQKLHEAKAILPINVCNTDLECNTFPNFDQHDFRHIDHSDLHTYVVHWPFPFEDLLSCECKHGSKQKTVLTIGACGIGKTTAVQQCVLNWAEEEAHQHIDLLFPFSCWELYHCVQHETSLITLLQMFFPEFSAFSPSSLSEMKVWFVFDGLNDFIDSLNFSCQKVSKVTQICDVNMIVVNLIRGDMLPNAHVWVTSQFSGANQIPRQFLLKTTQVQGFNNEQKELHIRRIVGDEDLANKVIDHIKISRSLHFLCQIPPICSIMATVLKKHVKKDENKIRPMSLTQIYFRLINDDEQDDAVLFYLKQYALSKVWRRTDQMPLHITKEELEKHEITVAEASAYAKECPLVLQEEKGLRNTSIFRIAHPSILDFFAALIKVDLQITEDDDSCFMDWRDYQETLHQVLKYPDGRYDVFLRFFFGILKERGKLDASDPFLAYTRNMILQNILNYSAVTLFHCLREFNSRALLNEVKTFQKTGFSPLPNFKELHWQLAMQRTTNFEGMRKQFEIELASRCDENVLRSVPEILKCQKAMLQFSNLTDACCPALATVLSTDVSHLRELDLAYNGISDRGVEVLVQGLNDEDCRLKSLGLKACELTSSACEHLATALKQSPELRELDLSCNTIGDVGLQHLASGLESPECHLETLRLSQCNIQREGCSHLALALEKNPKHLKWLDLSINKIGNKASNELFTKFDISQLAKLEMYYCGLTVESCKEIAKTLAIESSNLVELNLSNNKLEDAGIQLVCGAMLAWSRVEKLNLSRCGITKNGCLVISKVLTCVSQLCGEEDPVEFDWQATELSELNLSMNELTDDGVKHIAAGLTNPYSNLRKLNLSQCSLTYACCSDFADQLSTLECCITELDLSSNDIQDRGLKRLCLGLQNLQCRLEKLSLQCCGLSSNCVSFLKKALVTNQHLTELFVTGNNLDETAKRVLLRMTRSDEYILRNVDLSLD